MMFFRLIALLLLTLLTQEVTSFSAPEGGKDSPFALFDRFRPSCPADIGAIRLFEESLVGNDHPSATWVAVYRTANNKPSVFVKDEFLNAMRVATSVSTEKMSESKDSLETTSKSLLESTESPVAVARLTPSIDFDDCWVMDSMRCMLKKEKTDAACDGGSEHTEALCTAIDQVLIQHLTNHKGDRFDGAIRTKATLVSAPLLEERGFQEVQSLSKDMATHTCSLDACMTAYADRAVSTTGKGQGARDRALQICSLLGQIDRENDLKASAESSGDGRDVDDDYDPWANMKKFAR